MFIISICVNNKHMCLCAFNRIDSKKLNILITTQGRKSFSLSLIGYSRNVEYDYHQKDNK